MDFLLVAALALGASLLTFFTGFGLGTLLLPAFALFMPIGAAVAMTAVVHLVNGLLKLALTGRHVAWRIVPVFGIPAVAGSLLGAWLLLRVADAAPWLHWTLGGHDFAVTPVKLLVGVLLGVFSLAELVPRLKVLAFGPRWLAVGGALSGFFGGLAGMQGALRSAFLVRSALTKEQFIATGAALAVLIDLSRLGVYGRALRDATPDYAVLATGALAAAAGAVLGNLLLPKISLRAVERLVALLLFAAAFGLVTGLV
jgi:uncharacterized membrane protein YfcA